MPRRTAAPTTYRDAYAALSRIAAELESGDADLDTVLPLIEEARAAYAVCRGRIEALRLALGEEAASGPDRSGAGGDETDIQNDDIDIEDIDIEDDENSADEDTAF